MNCRNIAIDLNVDFNHYIEVKSHEVILLFIFIKLCYFIYW